MKFHIWNESNYVRLLKWKLPINIGTVKVRYRKYFEYSCTSNPDTLVRISYTDACTISTGQGTSKSAVTMMRAAATAATSDTQKLSLLYWRRYLLVCLLIFAARRLCRGATPACALVFSSSRLLAGGCWVCCRWLLGGAYSTFQHTAHTWAYDFRHQTSHVWWRKS